MRDFVAHKHLGLHHAWQSPSISCILNPDSLISGCQSPEEQNASMPLEGVCKYGSCQIMVVTRNPNTLLTRCSRGSSTFSPHIRGPDLTIFFKFGVSALLISKGWGGWGEKEITGLKLSSMRRVEQEPGLCTCGKAATIHECYFAGPALCVDTWRRKQPERMKQLSWWSAGPARGVVRVQSRSWALVSSFSSSREKTYLGPRS